MYKYIFIVYNDKKSNIIWILKKSIDSELLEVVFYIDIKFIDTTENQNTLIFSCRGEFASQTTTITDKTLGFFINKTFGKIKNIMIILFF
jgi:hypothetical protein